MNQDRPAGPDEGEKEARSGTGQGTPEGEPYPSPAPSHDPRAEGGDSGGTGTEPAAPVQTVEIRRGGGLAVFALLVALAGLGGSAYLWWQLRNAGQDEATARLTAGQASLGDQIAALESQAAQLEKQVAEATARATAAASAAAATPGEELRKGIEANRSATDSLQSKVASLDDQIEGTIAALEKRVQGLAGQLTTLTTPPAAPTEPSPDAEAKARAKAEEEAEARAKAEAEALAWRRGEVELLLRVAQRQATLAGDPADARQALMAADALIEEMDSPSLTPVRRAIAADLAALDALPEIDLDGLAFKLGSMQARVANLPLREEAAGEAGTADAEEAPAAGGLERLEQKSKEFVSGLIRVRDSRPDDRVFRSPAEVWFLRRNLELELQSARVALLTANPAAYRDSLKKAAAWTKEYFDPQDPGVQAFLESLQELEARPVAVEAPKLGSLAAFLGAARAATNE